MSDPQGIDQNVGAPVTHRPSEDCTSQSSTSSLDQVADKGTSHQSSFLSDTNTSMDQYVVSGDENQPSHSDYSNKTIEGQDSVAVAKTDQEETSSQSRELKLLLALSKEARLDTNISRKRKVQTIRKKQKSETRSRSKIQYPVTAESELEMEENHVEGSKLEDEMSSSKALKRKKSTISDSPSDNGLEGGTKKSRKSLSADVPVFKPNKDMFCWRCHKDTVNISCETCPRSYHQKCLKQTITDLDHWPCPECVAILKAESTHSRSPAMKGMNLEHLCSLLKFAVNRMVECQGSEPFIHAVSDTEFPEYKRYIIQPMDLTLLGKNIKENLYGSTQAFEADAKWILHNSIVFNSYQSKLTTVAKSIIKICKQEMSEIENCPTCYLNANTKKKTWFVEVCPKPHLLVWAKLRGFPFWPGKALRCKDGMVDVRFFGAHDRAWVPEKECFLYSPKDPNLFRVKRADIEQCVEELEVHVENLKKVFGEFNYPSFKTQIDPDNEEEQIKIFLPQYNDSLVKTLRGQYSDKEQRESKKFPEKETNDQVIDEGAGSNDRQTSGNAINNSLNTDDEAMEGYGTDDESVPEIDTEFRKTLLHQPESKSTDNLEADEDDTQVPANVEADTSGTEEILLSTSSVEAGNITASNKSISEPTSKRPSLEDDHPGKLLRRNSDTESTKISDKINRVNISENMEISLGNDEKGTISCIESISSSNSECSSEFSVELKKKPVQVDVDNVEFTISPASKLQITDKLMKRLSDGEASTDENSKARKLERAKRNLDETDETCKGIEKTSGTESSEGIEFESASVEQVNEGDLDKSQEANQTASDKIAVSPDKSPKKTSGSVVKTDLNSKNDDSATTSTENVNWTVRNVSPKSDGTKIVIKAVRSEEDQLGKSGYQGEGSEESCGFAEEDIGHITDKGETDERREAESADTERGISLTPSQSEHKSSGQQLESSTNLEELSTIKSSGCNKPSIKIILHPEKKNNDKSAEDKEHANLVKKTLKIGSNKSEKAILQSREDQVETPADQNSDKTEYNDETINNEEVQLNIDKESIINIIHSSLNESPATPSKKPASDRSQRSSTESDERKKGTKRKKSFVLDEGAIETQSKILKLVSIESIMNKANNNQENKDKPSSILKTSLQAKKVTKSAQNSPSSSSRSSVHEIATEEIKSEPESEAEVSGSTSQDMEAKKKYLSALNILDRREADAQKPKAHEIRTRSKTEEKRERFRVSNELHVVDNMTRIIDDVAVNYSAIRDGEPLSKKKAVVSVDGSKSDGCEIFVRSFAKISTSVPESNSSMIPTPPSKQRARKSFPQPNYTKFIVRPNAQPMSVLQSKNQPNVVLSTSESPLRTASKTPVAAVSSAALQVNSTAPVVKATTAPKTVLSHLQQIDPGRPTNGYLILQPQQQDNVVFFPPNQTLGYTTPLVSLANQVMSVTSCLVPTGSVAATNQAMRLSSQPQLWIPPIGLTEKERDLINVASSQNYIPQGEPVSSPSVVLTSPSPAVSSESSTKAINGPSPELTAVSPDNSIAEGLPTGGQLQDPQRSPETNALVLPQPAQPIAEPISATVEPIVIADGDDDFTVLNEIVPDTNLSRTISSLLRPPPILKPRPPGVLSQQISEAVPSTAGPVAARINSIAHKLGDYFRGLLIGTFEDLSKSDNPDATIASLKLEIETLKHTHSIEISEIERNVTTVLKDLQRSVVEDRQRIIDETRAACEAETIKKVEEAKSKQWCANCSKEAQFYCCWNTSYCDYPCQQKHWPAHMGKCAQNSNQTAENGPAPAVRPGGQQIILRPTNPPAKGGLGRVFSKPIQKVYVNRNLTAPKTMRVQTTTGNLLTMMETTPGNYQLVPTTTMLKSGPTLGAIQSNVISVSTASVSSSVTAIQQPPKPKLPVRLIGHSIPVASVIEDDSD